MAAHISCRERPFAGKPCREVGVTSIGGENQSPFTGAVMYSIDTKTGCWNWEKSIGANGYGVKHIGRTSITAHRYVYQQHVGQIPDGMELDHLCRNRRCVNPQHLEPVTHIENMMRCTPFAAKVMSNLCKHGHALDGVRTRSGGGRYCKTCVRLNKQRQRAASG